MVFREENEGRLEILYKFNPFPTVEVSGETEEQG